MGIMKQRALAEQEAYYAAVDFLCGLGVLEECENHPGTYFEGSGDITHAYQVANAGITAGTIALPPGETRRSYTDRLKATYDDNSGLDACQECAEHFGS